MHVDVTFKYTIHLKIIADQKLPLMAMALAMVGPQQTPQVQIPRSIHGDGMHHLTGLITQTTIVPGPDTKGIREPLSMS